MAETEVPQTGAPERRDAKWYAGRFMEVDWALSSVGVAWLTPEARAQVILGILHEMAQDLRSQEVRERRKSAGFEPATEAQREYLRKLGLQVGETVSREQASRLIDALKARPVQSPGSGSTK
jgi:hypothetical protein